MLFKKSLIVVFFLSSMILSGCNSSKITEEQAKITEEQAITTVKSTMDDDVHGKIKIISVTHKNGNYVVKWERKSNCDSGTVYVNDNSGKLTTGTYRICQ
jgi:major membrane immunogen (membrane-anchored lipoprotein)